MKTIVALALVFLASNQAYIAPDSASWLLAAFPNVVLAQKAPKIFVVVDQAKPDAVLKTLQQHTNESVAFADLKSANFGFPQDFSKFEVATYVTCGGRYCFLMTKFDKKSGYVFNLLPERGAKLVP
jgi:hypothetical protein